MIIYYSIVYGIWFYHYTYTLIYTLKVQDQTKNSLLSDLCDSVLPAEEFGRLGLPGYIYLEPEWPLFLIGKDIVLEGSTIKIEDK